MLRSTLSFAYTSESSSLFNETRNSSREVFKHFWLGYELKNNRSIERQGFNRLYNSSYRTGEYSIIGQKFKTVEKVMI